ncbi:MAG TPA: hypothetical protein PLB81_07880, partial [Deltaproteobacteria bacterium]|nr:hypothetical protein [Deltaproteobacteria bacterium]
MRKVLKGIVLGVCAILILALGIFAGAHLFLKTDAGAEQIIKLINSLIPGKISGRDIRLSLMDQAVTMRDATLKGADGRAIIQARRLRLIMDIPAFSRGELLFRSIHLDHPVGSLMLEADGRFNIEKAFVEKRSDKEGLSVLIQKLTAHAGDLDVCGPDGKTWARLKKFDLAFSAAFAADTMMRLSIPRSHLTVFLGEREIDCGIGALSGAVIGDRIQDILFTAQKNTSRVVVKAAVDNLAHKANLSLAANLDLELGDVRHGLGIPEQTRGRISGTLNVSGAFDNPDLACDLSYGGGEIAGQSIGPVTLRGALHDRIFSCNEAAYSLAAGRLQAAGAVDLNPVFPHGYGGLMHMDKLAYRLSVIASGLRLDQAHASLRGVGGRLNATMRIQGQGIDLQTLAMRATFNAGVTGFALGDLIPKTTLTSSGRLDYRGGIVFFSPVTAGMNAALLTASGRVALDARKTIAGTVDIWIPRVERFLPTFTAEARGALNARAKLSGTLTAPQADIVLSGQGCGWRDIVLGAFDVDGRLDQSGVLTVSRCRIRNQSSLIDANGTVRLIRGFPHLDPKLDMSMNAAFEALTPRHFLPGLPLSGRLAGQFTAAGNTDRLEGQTVLTGEDMRYADMPLGALDMRAVLHDGMLFIRQAGLKRGNSSVAITGSARVFEEKPLAWVHDPAVDLRITEGNLRLEDFFPDASGQTTVAGSLHGTLKQPRGELLFSGRAVKLGPQELDALDMTAHIVDQTLSIDHFGARIVPGQEVKGSGWLNRQGAYALKLEERAIELAGLDVFKAEDGIAGRMDLALAGRGTIDHPQLSGHVGIQGLKIKDQAFPDARITLELNDQRLDFEGMLPFPVSGWYDLARDTYQGEAVFDHTDLTPFFGVFGKPGLSGEISGRVSGSGRGLHLRGIDTLDADLKDIGISRGQRPLIQADTIKGTYSHRTL